MKGRLLTIEEIEQLKQTDEKFILKRIDDEIIIKVGKHSYVDVFNNWVASFKCVGLMDGTFKIYEYIEEPKTYKTSEMIAMLEENPKLKFENNRNHKAELRQGIIVNSYGTDLTVHLDKNIEWKLIEEPKEVTFLEALKEFDNGKKIYVLFNGRKAIFSQSKRTTSETGYGKWFVDDKGINLSTKQVLEGKWYVED